MPVVESRMREMRSFTSHALIMGRHVGIRVIEAGVSNIAEQVRHIRSDIQAEKSFISFGQTELPLREGVVGDLKRKVKVLRAVAGEQVEVTKRLDVHGLIQNVRRGMSRGATEGQVEIYIGQLSRLPKKTPQRST
jgi:hypothetical protein